MQNVHGYSPHQFGQNSNLPSVLIDKYPALEGTTQSKWVARHITALCLHKLQEGLLQKRSVQKEYGEPCGNTMMKIMKVELLYTTKEWIGPGVVIGQDGAVIFVRHYIDQSVKPDSEHDTNMEQGQDIANSDLEVTQGLRQREPQLQPRATRLRSGTLNCP